MNLIYLNHIRTRNPNAMQHVSFELSDLADPTKMLCKVDNVLRAYSGHIDVHDDPSLVCMTFSSLSSFPLCVLNINLYKGL